MGQPIESGIISDAVGKFSNFLTKLFDHLYDEGNKTSDYKPIKSEKGEDIGYSFTLTSAQGHQLHVKGLRSAGQSKLFDFYILGDRGNKKKYLHKSEDDLDDIIGNFLDEYYQEPDSASVEEADYDSKMSDVIDVKDEGFKASKKIQISLSKIQASDEIVFGPIYCNYNELEVYSDLENVLDSDEFVDSLTEDPQSFEIVPDEDEFEIVEIDEIEPMNYASSIIRAQFIAIMQLFSCKWNAECMLDDDPMRWINTIRWQLDYMVSSKLSALDVDIQSILKSIQPEEIEPKGDVSSIVDNYATVLDLYYSNFPHEVQKLLDDWLLTLRYSCI